MKALLSSTYFGPIQWYQKLNRYDECLIERHESFIKQTYRNRMIIPTTNGPLSLTIPTNHDISLSMKDIRISDHANWRHVHWNALLSAYGESPFFEYYQDDIRPFYEKKYEFLFDFNMETTAKMIELLDIRPKISVTDEYVLSEERKVKSIESEERRVKSEETTFGDRRESQFNSPEAQAQFNIQHSTFNTQHSFEGQTIVMQKNTHQAHVMIGTRAYDVNDSRRMPLYLLNNMLGGPGMNAKLNLALREHNGLVYTVESTMVAYGDTGIWSIYFGCDEHDVKRCLRLVRKELDKFMQKPLSEAQLKAAKKQIKGQVGVACDNRENFALDFGKSFLHYGWEKNVDRLYEQVDEITAEQIQAVAQELFDKDRLTTLIFR